MIKSLRHAPLIFLWRGHTWKAISQGGVSGCPRDARPVVYEYGSNRRTINESDYEKQMTKTRKAVEICVRLFFENCAVAVIMMTMMWPLTWHGMAVVPTKKKNHVQWRRRWEQEQETRNNEANKKVFSWGGLLITDHVSARADHSESTAIWIGDSVIIGIRSPPRSWYRGQYHSRLGIDICWAINNDTHGRTLQRALLLTFRKWRIASMRVLHH